ncbi:hypothetical protein ACGE0T_04700 [Parabacteroides sp. APC149_11_2_Y6]
MKRLKVLSLAAAAAGVMLLTSCMKGNSSYSTADYALVESSSKPPYQKLVYPSSDYPLYISNATNILELKDGTCMAVYYTVDNDAAENANFATKGYKTATLAANYSIIKDSPMVLGASDTTKVLDPVGDKKEILFTSSKIASFVSGTSKKRLFIEATLPKMLTKQENDYILSCDFSQQPETVNGENVYTIFFRGKKKADGETPTIEGASVAHAFEAENFYNYAKSKATSQSGSDKKISFRLKFPKEFNADSTKIKTWGTSDVVTFVIPAES